MTPLKLTLSLFMVTGCGTDEAKPPANSANDKQEAPKIQMENRKSNKASGHQRNSLNNESAPFGIPKVTQKKENQKVLIDAPHIKQKPELARGCEVTSMAMLLNHSGASVDKMTLAHRVKKVPYEKNGLRGNLNDGFVGNIRTFDQPGIGVYHGPMKDLAESYLPGKVIDFTGKEFDEVIAQLDQKRPVWVVVTSTYDVVPETHWETWKTSSGPLKITFKMHSVLVTGYDKDYIYVNDPLSAKNRKLPRQKFIAGWEQMGNQAITIKN
ncbi:MAG: C39 family peptidase [Bacillota bacterium]